MTITKEQLDRAEAKLTTYIHKPDHRTIEERAPLLYLKDGRRVMFERFGKSWVISQDFGCTCREVARVPSIRAAAKFLLTF